MPDPVVSATPPVAPVTGEKASAEVPAQFVSKAEFDALQKRIQDQSDILGGIRTSLKQLAPKEAPKPTEQDQTLTARVKAIEERESVQREAMRFGSLKAAAMAKGVPETRAEQFSRYVLATDHGKAISVDSNFRVTYQEGEKQTPVSDWAGAFLASQEGEIFLPPKGSGPSGDGLRSGSGSAVSAASPYLGMSFEQIMESKKRDYKGFTEYVTKHESDWVNKQSAYRPR